MSAWRRRRPPTGGQPLLVEALIARVLLGGGVIGVAIVIVGLAVFGVRGGFHDHALPLERAVHAGAGARAPGVFVSIGGIRRALEAHPPDPLAVVALGLLCLLGTPVAGIALAIPAFLAARDTRYAVMAAIVLALLIVGALVSGGVG